DRKSKLATTRSSFRPRHPGLALTKGSGASELFEVRGHHISRLLAAHHRHDFKGRARAAPFEYPCLQQPQIVTLHKLKAATEVRLYPAIDVVEAFREHSAFVADALVDRQHVSVPEPLDDHEQHSATPDRCLSEQKPWELLSRLVQFHPQ